MTVSEENTVTAAHPDNGKGPRVVLMVGFDMFSRTAVDARSLLNLAPLDVSVQVGAAIRPALFLGAYDVSLAPFARSCGMTLVAVSLIGPCGRSAFAQEGFTHPAQCMM